MNRSASIINHFVYLLTLKNKPQDLRYSFNIFIFLLILLIALVKVSAADSIIYGQNFSAYTFIFARLVYESVFLLVLYFTLVWHGIANRFIQAACNFLGVNIVDCIAMALISSSPLHMIFLSGIKAWLLIIKFYITKHAFDVDQRRAIMLYILMSVIAFAIILWPLSMLFKFAPVAQMDSAVPS